MNAIVCDRCGKTETNSESFASIKHKRTLEIKFYREIANTVARRIREAVGV